VVNGPQFVVGVEEDVTAFAVGVVAEQVEERHGLEFAFFLVAEVEVVVVGIELDVLLQRTWAVGTVFAKNSIGDEAEAERLADEIRGDLAQGEGVLFKIPKRLFAAARLVDGGEGLACVGHVHEEGVVGAEHELTLEFDLAVGEGFGEGGHGAIIRQRLLVENYGHKFAGVSKQAFDAGSINVL